MPDEHPAGSASSGTDVLAAGGVNVHRPLPPGLGEERRHLRRLAKVVRSGSSFVVTQDHVGPGHVPRMKPQVLGARHLKGQVLVLFRAAADEYRESSTAQVVPGSRGGASVFLRLGRGVRCVLVELAPVASVHELGLALRLGLESRSGFATTQLDLLPGAPRPPRPREAALGVLDAAEPGVDGEDERPLGIVRIGDGDLGRARGETVTVREQRLGFTTQRRLVGQACEVPYQIDLEPLETTDAAASLPER